eukprot:scaffold845_cov364-Prasinococcus_capsulatus_cf.AAC.13
MSTGRVPSDHPAQVIITAIPATQSHRSASASGCARTDTSAGRTGWSLPVDVHAVEFFTLDEAYHLLGEPLPSLRTLAHLHEGRGAPGTAHTDEQLGVVLSSVFLDLRQKIWRRESLQRRQAAITIYFDGEENLRSPRPQGRQVSVMVRQRGGGGSQAGLHVRHHSKAAGGLLLLLLLYVCYVLRHQLAQHRDGLSRRLAAKFLLPGGCVVALAEGLALAHARGRRMRLAAANGSHPRRAKARKDEAHAHEAQPSYATKTIPSLALPGRRRRARRLLPQPASYLARRAMLPHAVSAPGPLAFVASWLKRELRGGCLWKDGRTAGAMPSRAGRGGSSSAPARAMLTARRSLSTEGKVEGNQHVKDDAANPANAHAAVDDCSAGAAGARFLYSATVRRSAAPPLQPGC